MTEISVKTEKTEYSILHEINSFQSLVNKRNAWLNVPENKLRGTYKAVLKDTREMEDKLKELRKELEEFQKNQ